MRTLHLVALLVICSAIEARTEHPCNVNLTVDLGDGTRLKDGGIQLGDFLFNENQYFSVGSENKTYLLGCVCMLKPCYRKCCAKHQIFKDGRCQDDALSENFTALVHEAAAPQNVSIEQLAQVNGMGCPSDQLTVLEPEEGDEFYLQTNGSLYIPNNPRWRTVPPERFCLELYDEEDLKGVTALVCNEEILKSDYVSPTLYSAAMVFAMPFLLATLLVYGLLVPELQNIHGRSIMCYVLALFVAYLILVIVTLMGADVDSIFCVIAPFIMYYSFMASFFWLNVMCVDVWWTFSGRRGFGGSDKRSESIRFFWYSVYAWGMSGAALVITLAMQFAPSLPKSVVRPRFGARRCWFPDARTQGYYFYSPMLATIVLNVVLFVWTAVNIWKVKCETAKSMDKESKRHGDDGKQRYQLYLKLFLAFGVNWSLELLSWPLGGPRWAWYFPDLLNILYGVFIFYMSVCNANVLNLLKRRFNRDAASPKSAVSTELSESASSFNSNPHRV